MTTDEFDHGRDDMRDATPASGRWTAEEDEKLRRAVLEHGPQNWKKISLLMANGARTDTQCLHRWKKVLRPGIIKGPWTKEEDITLVQLVHRYNSENIKWSEIAASLPGRLGKQARERWFNHLDPSLKKEAWSEDEHRILMESQNDMGNKWTEIAKLLPGRSENAVKNRWNSTMRRRKHAAEASMRRTTSGVGNDSSDLDHLPGCKLRGTTAGGGRGGG